MLPDILEFLRTGNEIGLSTTTLGFLYLAWRMDKRITILEVKGK